MYVLLLLLLSFLLPLYLRDSQACSPYRMRCFNDNSGAPDLKAYVIIYSIVYNTISKYMLYIGVYAHIWSNTVSICRCMYYIMLYYVMYVILCYIILYYIILYYINVYMYVYMCVYIYIYIYVCMYVYMHMCIYIYIYIHIYYTSISGSQASRTPPPTRRP